MCGTVQNATRADILALTKKLYDIGKKRIASGKDVSQENIAILNRTREAIAKRETAEGQTSQLNGEENGRR